MNHQDTKTLEHLDDIGKMTSETEWAMMAYLDDDDANLNYHRSISSYSIRIYSSDVVPYCIFYLCNQN
jgi:hypothetical protein